MVSRNGAFTASRPAIPDLSPEDIVSRVKMHEDATVALRERMEGDYDLYRLIEYTGRFPGQTEEQADNERGYRHYTSNSPRTFADKLISWISQSQRIIRCVSPLENEQSRRLNSLKESFALGLLAKIDEDLDAQLLPPLIDQIGFFVCIPGMTMGRAVLVRTPDGGTEINVTPWDPKDVFWGLGSRQIEWACHRIKKTRLEILTEYGVDLVEADESHSDSGVTIYDYYDGVFNAVVTEDRYLKRPTPHGSPRIPVWAAISGFNPRINSSRTTDTTADFSESIYASTRDTHDQLNFLFSVVLELAARARKPGNNLYSRTGDFTVEGDLNQEGADISLSTANDERIEIRQALQSTPDLGSMLGLISAEEQRGQLPHSTFGQLAFQLSGFAINTLNQDVISKLAPRVRVVETALKQIVNLLSDQYATGAFEPLTLAGVGQNRRYFHETFDPRIISTGGNYSVKLVPQLPQDDQTKVQMAQLLRQGEVPLAPDTYIWDQVLEIQDVDNFADQISAQMAKRSTPLAVMFEMMQAALNQGDEQLARIYLGEMMRLMLFQQAQGIPPTVEPPGGPQPGTPAQPRGTGFSPQQAPPESFGIQSRPNLQSGPNVPPGSPRPGATNEQRLNGLGLISPQQGGI